MNLKRIVIGVIGIIFMTGPAMAETTQTIVYDEITNQAWIQLKIPLNHKTIESLDIHYSFGEKFVENSFSPQLFCKNNKWKYIDCHILYFYINDEAFLLTADHLGITSKEGDKIEFIFFKFPLDFFTKILTAKTIRFNLCDAEIVLNTEQVESLKQFTIGRGPKK